MTKVTLYHEDGRTVQTFPVSVKGWEAYGFTTTKPKKKAKKKKKAEPKVEEKVVDTEDKKEDK